MSRSENDKVILGVDPGTKLLGYGLISIESKKMKLMQYGIINLSKYSSMALKLAKIYERMSQIIEEYMPDEMALESPFYGENVQVALKLGRAQGVAMAAALSRQIPITEYAPKKIKQSVTGNGSASKEQVAKMLETHLNFKAEDDALLDATDALGVAVCHYFQGNLPQGKTTKNWSAFVKDNPDRIK